MVSVDVNHHVYLLIGLSLSLICDPTSEDIKQHYLPTGPRVAAVGLLSTTGLGYGPRPDLTFRSALLSSGRRALVSVVLNTKDL